MSVDEVTQAGSRKATFDNDQQSGYDDLFLASCAFINNGSYQIPSDIGEFKVPTLRNVLLTYPYMHDGRFFTIDQVLDHYDHGIVDSPTLSAELTNGIQFTETERFQLKKFLETLIDYTLLDSKLIAEP
ncbi:MAG: hypothetical protein AB8B56_17450 [Crocinitomicaceae bacterium]